MEDIAEFALKLAQPKVDYADVRAEAYYEEDILALNGEIDKASLSLSRGLGVRVLFSGSWGFQSTNELTKSSASDCVAKAVRAAKSHANGDVKLAPTKAYQDNYSALIKKKLRDIDISEKINDILEVDKMLKGDKIVRRTINYTGREIEKIFINSEGAKIKFTNCLLRLNLRADAKEGKINQRYEKIIGGSGGYELLENSTQEAEFVRKKAQKLVNAKPIKKFKDATIVVDSDYLTLLIHEIVGHPSEADRVLGREAAWAGTTWWAGKLGQRIASPALTVYDDPTVEGTYGYFKYDDEGVKSRRKILIRNGVLNEHMHSRETAAIFGVEPNAGMRARTYEYVPLIRMSNTFVAPGDWKNEEIVEDTKRGFLISAWRDTSIDDKRYNWNISAQEAWEISNGELGEHYRDVSLMGTSPIFFKTIDAVGDKIKIGNLPNCGKGDPIQLMYVGNGGPYLRGRATILGR
ncbi:MAG: TldD/PmbA family protein [Candidatus Thermoplasmatota archaeon]